MPRTYLSKIDQIEQRSFSHFIYHNFNNLFSSDFHSNLKTADILPTHKKKDKSDIENCYPISILPTLSRIYMCVRPNSWSYSF